MAALNTESVHSGNPICDRWGRLDRKSTRLNSSHLVISYAVFCLKKKKEYVKSTYRPRQTQHYCWRATYPLGYCSVSISALSPCLSYPVFGCLQAVSSVSRSIPAM